MGFIVGQEVTSTNAKNPWREYGVGKVVDISGDYNLNADYPIAVAFGDASLILKYDADGVPVLVSAFYTVDGVGADGDTLSNN